jgi:hypothetical protein
MEYVGLRQIAKRLGWKSPSSVLRSIEKHGLLAFCLPGPGGKPRWRTNDELLSLWHITLCRASRQALRERRQQAAILRTEGQTQ